MPGTKVSGGKSQTLGGGIEPTWPSSKQARAAILHAASQLRVVYTKAGRLSRAKLKSALLALRDAVTALRAFAADLAKYLHLDQSLTVIDQADVVAEILKLATRALSSYKLAAAEAYAKVCLLFCQKVFK